jgi:hypothetical protein
LLAEAGPVVRSQLVTPVTPVMLHMPVPVGARAVAGPVTVALKEIVEPSRPVEASAVTETLGVTAVTVVVLPDVGATPK